MKRTAGSGLAKYPGNNKTVSVNGEGVPTNDDGKHYLTIDQVLQQLYNKKMMTDLLIGRERMMINQLLILPLLMNIIMKKGIKIGKNL